MAAREKVPVEKAQRPADKTFDSYTASVILRQDGGATVYIRNTGFGYEMCISGTLAINEDTLQQIVSVCQRPFFDVLNDVEIVNWRGYRDQLDDEDDDND